MRPDASAEKRVAIHQEMVGGDGRRHVIPRFAYELCRLGSRDVLEDRTQAREFFVER